MKTRLAASIGEERTLAVYEAMLHDLLRAVGPSTPDLEIELLWAPTEAADGETLRRAFGDRPLAMQTGANLGDRLSMAFSERFFFHRTQKIIAIGVDDPTLGRESIDQALALLDSCDWVVGPATDGGYYLIGCRAAAFNSDIFRDIAWGTSTVLDATLARIHAAQSPVALLAPRSDIDTVDDLERFAAEEHTGELAALLREG